MLYDFLKHKSLIDTALIEERFDSLKVKLELSESIGTFPVDLLEVLKSISERDTFELFFDIGGNHITVRNCSSENLEVIRNHISDNSDDTDYTVELHIKKTLDTSCLSIYFLDEFSTYLDCENLHNIILTISKLFEKRLDFEVFSQLEAFGSSTISFIQAGSTTKLCGLAPTVNRNEKIDLFLENASVTNLDIKVLPSDFYLLAESKNTRLNNIFKNLCATLSLVFISNISEINKDGTLQYRVSGYKTVNRDRVDVSSIRNDYLLLFKIYEWAYEGGSGADKIGLVRNVLSIHLDDTGNIKFDSDVWQAIQSNYQIYLKKNIQNYLEVKNKISEIVIESTMKTYSIVDEMLDSLKNNVFALMTFILSVVVVNGLKDNGYTEIFSNVYLIIVVILTVVSLLWLAMIRSELSNGFNHTIETIKESLSINYNKVLMESEIKECVDPIVKKNTTFFNKQKDRYSIWWICILLVFLCSFLIANRCLVDDKGGSVDGAENLPKILKGRS